MYDPLAHDVTGSVSISKYNDIEVMDTVRFREPIIAHNAFLGQDVELPEGTEATVISIVGEDGTFKLQVSDPETGIPICFVDTYYDQLILAD